MHAILVGAALFAAPLQFHKPQQFGEVIRVNAVSMDQIRGLNQPKAQPVPEVKTPAPAEMEPEEVPVSEPTTKPAVEVKKPEKKPEPAKKPEQTKVVQDSKAAEGGEGGAEVEAPSGGAISGVRVDQANFDHPYWFDLAWNKINQNYRFSITIDGRIYCDIYFVVIKSGRVIEAKIAKSSGIPAFDQACLNAVERSSPFPPLPRDWLDEILGITITFTNNF
jgi:protein TonB